METPSLRTLKIMPRNLNEIVRSWILRLVSSPHSVLQAHDQKLQFFFSPYLAWLGMLLFTCKMTWHVFHKPHDWTLENAFWTWRTNCIYQRTRRDTNLFTCIKEWLISMLLFICDIPVYQGRAWMDCNSPVKGLTCCYSYEKIYRGIGHSVIQLGKSWNCHYLSTFSLRGMLLFASERVNYLHGIASTRVGHALLTFDMARDAVLFHWEATGLCC